MKEINKIFRKLKTKRNVIGCSKTLMPILVEGKPITEKGIRVYVKKKVPVEYLHKKDIIPRKIEGIRVDVVEIGEVNALEAMKVDKTKPFEPIPLGASVGHKDITAGSLGLLCVKDSQMHAASNAHVLVPNASLKPEQITEKRICQPGPYHHKPCRVCGEYAWHKRVVPITETCPISKAILDVLNFFARLLGSSTHFIAQGEPVNHIDFAVYYPTIEHVDRYADNSIPPDCPIIGLLFAGSEKVGVICKAKYIQQEGYSFLHPIHEVSVGNKVAGCSFWCSYTTEVTDTSARLQVNYRDFIALFDDVILVKNEGVIKGGWSGSSWRLV